MLILHFWYDEWASNMIIRTTLEILPKTIIKFKIELLQVDHSAAINFKAITARKLHFV